MNKKNHIPPVTVHLGEALDLVTEYNGTRTRWDLAGYQLLVDARAMDHRAPGRARLYAVKGDLSETIPNSLNRATAIGTWKRWTQRERPDFIGGMFELPDEISDRVGRAVAIGYRSDKWHKPGQARDYQHDFSRRKPPLVYIDDREKPRAVLITGGNLRISERGIEN